MELPDTPQLPDRPVEASSSAPPPPWVPLQDVLQAARGPQYWGIYRNVAILYSLHLLGVGALLLLDGYLTYAVKGALTARSARDDLYVAFLLFTLGVHAINHRKLYGSDPGWITFDTKLDDPQLPCQFCRMAPSFRSRHDHNTGQCVHKFDHFCAILGTAIGDVNHLRFWAFQAIQTFLILWGIVLAWDGVRHCVAASQQVSCWTVEPWRTACLIAMLFGLFIALNICGALLILHSYLAATNQTTYEVMKGEKVPYLEPFYRQYRGPKQTSLLGKELVQFIVRVCRQQGPPAPFSDGIANNLNLFFFGKKPHAYKHQTGSSVQEDAA